MVSVAAAAAVTPVYQALVPRQSAGTTDFCCPPTDNTPAGTIGFVLDPNTSFPECG